MEKRSLGLATPQDRVVGATVRLIRLGGQGVLVPGGFIVTAAHCIKWTGDGGMALGDCYIETIATADGNELRVTPVFADPVSDIAALGALDYFNDITAFDAWCESTSPVEICQQTPTQHGESLEVTVRTHTNRLLKKSETSLLVETKARLYV